MLSGKTVLLGVTGSIAAYKSAMLASMLVKQHCDVHVLMTKNATQFISPMTFETLTGNKVPVDTFDRNFQFSVEHVALAKKADLVMVAPATANVIAKFACGIADDMLTTTILACRCPKIVSPAMNTGMFENPVTKRNLSVLHELGWNVKEPAVGYLACGDSGKGKMPEPYELFQEIVFHISHKKDLIGKKVLVTAGPTQEALDPVRYITNHSSGKMGYALAWAAACRGANVTLVTGPVSQNVLPHICTVPVISAEDMFKAVSSFSDEQDIIIKAAAVADYRPVCKAQQKIKKSEQQLSVPLERTTDILKYLGERKKHSQFLCGFSMETQNLLENARKKLEKKNLDFIAANHLRQEGAGFGTETNIITLISKTDEISFPCMSKQELAHELVNEILNRFSGAYLKTKN